MLLTWLQLGRYYKAEGMKDEFDVTVICTVTTYTRKLDEKYKEKKFYKEEINGVKVIRVPVPEFKKKYGLENKFIIMYSGNIGFYYDLEGLIKVIEKFKGAKTPDGRDVIFAFVGAGSVLNRLVMYVKEHGMDNTVFIPYQDKDKLIYSLNAADVHWCVNAKGIKGVSCPNKFYGIAGVGKPVLAVLENGVEVEMLINEIGCGIVSEPGNYKAIADDVRWFIDNAGSNELAGMGKQGHEYLVDYLTKNVSVGRLR